MKLFIVIFSLSLLSCNNEENKIEMPDQLIPGVTGSWWKYNINTYDQKDNIVKSGEQIMQLSDPIVSDGVTGYKVDNLLPLRFGFSFPNKVSNYYMNSNQGLLRAQKDESYETFPPEKIAFSLFFKYPTFVSDTTATNNIIIKTLSTNDQVSVSMGKYDCIKYTYLLQNDTIGVIWFKPKVGMIKSIEYFGTDKIIAELLDYKIKL